MARKRIKVSRRMLFTWFMLAGLIFLFMPEKLTGNFQSLFARLFSLPLGISRSISLATSSHQQSLKHTVSMTEYNRLQTHLTNVIEQRDVAYRTIEKLTGIRNRFGLEGAGLVVADVIVACIQGHNNYLIINRGSSDGLRQGQYVLAENSVIGTVFSVSSRQARIKLFTDAASKTEIIIAGKEWFMQGSGNGLAKVKMLSTENKIKLGDRIRVRKKPGLLDLSMAAGVVAQCSEDGEFPLIWNISVEPACVLETVKNVAVIIMNPQ